MAIPSEGIYEANRTVENARPPPLVESEAVNNSGVRGLPAFDLPGRPINLNFITGHLQHPEAQSPAVREYIEQSHPFRGINLFTLVNVSGAGKTKCLFDVLTHRWGLYLSCKDDEPAGMMMDLIRKAVVREKNSDVDILRALLQHELQLLLCCRLLQMLSARFLHGMDRREWLGCQLSPYFGASAKSVVQILREHESGDVDSLCGALLELVHHLSEDESFLPIAIDEAQLWVTELENKFPSMAKVVPGSPPVRQTFFGLGRFLISHRFLIVPASANAWPLVTRAPHTVPPWVLARPHCWNVSVAAGGGQALLCCRKTGSRVQARTAPVAPVHRRRQEAVYAVPRHSS